MKLKANIKTKGLYTLTLRNTDSGEEKIYHTHNVITDYGIYAIITSNGLKQSTVTCGSGSGTPQSSDTDMFTKLWTVNCNEKARDMSWIDDDTKFLSHTLVIPASDSYVGTITEIGLGSSGSLITHALLQDSEGNPISVEKTGIDELEVKFDFYISRNTDRYGLRFNLDNGPFGAFNCWGGQSGKDYERSNFLYSNAAIWALSKSANPDHTIAFAMNKRSSCTRDGRKYTFEKVRYPAGEGDSFYVNSINWCTNDSHDDNFNPLAAVVFPCSDIFPQRTISGLSLGTGDGETTVFNPPLPAWVKDTEVIYKNGVALTRDVDYTCDNICNTGMDLGMAQSTFVDKYISGLYLGKSDYGGIGYPTYNYRQDYYDFGDNVYITEEKPVILKYYEDSLMGNSINSIIVGSWYGVGKNMSLVFSVSEDGETYTDVLSVKASYSGTFKDTTIHKLDQDYVMKYMKISVVRADGDTASYKVYSYPRPSGISDQMFFHLGQGITFKEAPAEGDVLTMDAGIDRPWKSPDYIMDFAPIITF